MAQPFGVGDVVGGRYRITHHVVTSADQDIVFQGVDEVLDREVSILLASRSNAKQVATSAKELAAGERESGVQVLDLGLAEDRTYLISSLTDPNALLDLVVPDTAPYVEPFFTDSLGSELFGQSRVMEPETYEDDAEYYARLHGLSGEETEDAGDRYRKRRPAFLDKVSDQLNRHLGTEKDADRIPGNSQAASIPEQDRRSEADSQTSEQPPTAGQETLSTQEQDETAPDGSRPENPDTADGELNTADAGSVGQSTASGAPRPVSGRTRERTSAPPFPIPMSPSSEPAQAQAPTAPSAPGGAFAPGRTSASSALGNLSTSLRDMELVESHARSDTEEEFGVRAQDDGSFLPTGTVSFDGAAAVRNGTGEKSLRAQPHNVLEAPLPPPAGEGGVASLPQAEESVLTSVSARIAEGEEVVDDPPAGPVSTYDRPVLPTPAEDAGPTTTERSAEALAAPPQQPDSFTGLIRAVSDDRPRAFPAAAAGVESVPAAAQSAETRQRPDEDIQDNSPGAGRWVAAVLLAALVAAVAVIAFLFLGTAG